MTCINGEIGCRKHELNGKISSIRHGWKQRNILQELLCETPKQCSKPRSITSIYQIAVVSEQRLKDASGQEQDLFPSLQLALGPLSLRNILQLPQIITQSRMHVHFCRTHVQLPSTLVDTRILGSRRINLPTAIEKKYDGSAEEREEEVFGVGGRTHGLRKEVSGRMYKEIYLKRIIEGFTSLTKSAM